MKGEEFEAEHKKKTKELKPHIWGCHWEIEEVMWEENIDIPQADYSLFVFRWTLLPLPLN